MSGLAWPSAVQDHNYVLLIMALYSACFKNHKERAEAEVRTLRTTSLGRNCLVPIANRVLSSVFMRTSKFCCFKIFLGFQPQVFLQCS